MLSGLIGSGDAVIADAQAEILTYLASFNDKVLAVDMEAGGLSLARYERPVITGRPCGWVVIRGISDTADPGRTTTLTASPHARRRGPASPAPCPGRRRRN
jgi:adenosylhomocysteine nucleosidase